MRLFCISNLTTNLYSTLLLYTYTDGPPPPLTVGQIGAVMSMPGCLDQTIHADTSHLYTHTQLPGHYFNLFIPAIQPLNSGGEGVLKSGGEGELKNGGFDIGQTAFVVGSHHIQVSYDIMVGMSGNVHLLNRLIRPHLQTGDALIFDCRILHLGLANRGQNYDI